VLNALRAFFKGRDIVSKAIEFFILIGVNYYT
jgi:hypothetical protein